MKNKLTRLNNVCSLSFFLRNNEIGNSNSIGSTVNNGLPMGLVPFVVWKKIGPILIRIVFSFILVLLKVSSSLSSSIKLDITGIIVSSIFIYGMMFS